MSKCEEIQRQRAEKSGRGKTCGEIKKSVKAGCGVCSVFREIYGGIQNFYESVPLRIFDPL